MLAIKEIIVQRQLEVRGMLLRAALDRHSVLLSTLSIDESTMESYGLRGKVLQYCSDKFSLALDN